jgi:hypothetical protein
MYRDCVTGNVRDADCSQDRKRMVVRNVKRDRRWALSERKKGFAGSMRFFDCTD